MPTPPFSGHAGKGSAGSGISGGGGGGSWPALPAADKYVYLGADPTIWPVTSLDATTGVNTADVTDPAGAHAATKATDGFSGGAHQAYKNFNSGALGGTHYCGVMFAQAKALSAITHLAVELVASPSYRSATRIVRLADGVVTDTHDIGGPVAVSIQTDVVGSWVRICLLADMAGGSDDYFVIGASIAGVPTYDGNGMAAYVGADNAVYLYSQAVP